MYDELRTIEVGHLAPRSEPVFTEPLPLQNSSANIHRNPTASNQLTPHTSSNTTTTMWITHLAPRRPLPPGPPQKARQAPLPRPRQRRQRQPSSASYPTKLSNTTSQYNIPLTDPDHGQHNLQCVRHRRPSASPPSLAGLLPRMPRRRLYRHPRDRDRISETKAELDALLGMEELTGVSIEILGNKIDNPDAMPEMELRYELGVFQRWMIGLKSSCARYSMGRSMIIGLSG